MSYALSVLGNISIKIWIHHIARWICFDTPREVESAKAHYLQNYIDVYYHQSLSLKIVTMFLPCVLEKYMALSAL